MDQKKRIIELVEKEILTTEEALSLLENMAEQEDELSESANFTSLIDERLAANRHASKKAEDSNDDSLTSKKLQQEKNALKDEIQQVNQEMTTTQESINRLQAEAKQFEQTQARQVAQLENEIKNIEQEIALVQNVHEVDSSSELVDLFDQLSTKQRELEAIGMKFETKEARAELENQLAECQDHLKMVADKKEQLVQKLHHLSVQQKAAAQEQKNSSKSDDPAEDPVSQTISQLGELMSAGLDKFTQIVGDFDWSEAKDKIKKGMVSDKITKTWEFSDPELTVLDFKNANGNLEFHESRDDILRIEVELAIYGSIDEEVETAITSRMHIVENQGKLKFHIPNKRIQADWKIWLPKRTYDYIALRVLNGAVTFAPLQANDVMVHVTSGAIIFDQLSATLLELKGTNGAITLNDADLHDLLINTVNGSVQMTGCVQNSQITTGNGAIRQTLFNEDIVRLSNQTVKGPIKVAVPQALGIEGVAETTFAQIHSRLSEAVVQSVPSKKNNQMTIMRAGTTQMALHLKTVMGAIFLKDSQPEEQMEE